MITKFDLFESMTSKPIAKYPTDKCIHIYAIKDKLEEKGMDIGNLRPGVPTKNVYHDFNFFDFMNEKLSENVIFPKIRLRDMDKMGDSRYDKFIDGGSVLLLPTSYDSSKDYGDWLRQKEEGRNRLIDTFKKLYKGKKLEDVVDNMDKHVDFGRHDFYWANDVLKVAHDEFIQYYKNGYLRVWMPFDLDTDDNWNFEHRYPFEKLLYYSDIMNYIKTNYNLEDDSIYDWFIKQDYIEGRYSERELGLPLDNGSISIKPRFDGGKNPSKDIIDIIGVMNHEFKDDIKNHTDEDGEEFKYYMDIYKEIKFDED